MLLTLEHVRRDGIAKYRCQVAGAPAGVWESRSPGISRARTGESADGGFIMSSRTWWSARNAGTNMAMSDLSWLSSVAHPCRRPGPAGTARARAAGVVGFEVLGEGVHLWQPAASQHEVQRQGRHGQQGDLNQLGGRRYIRQRLPEAEIQNGTTKNRTLPFTRDGNRLIVMLRMMSCVACSGHAMARSKDEKALPGATNRAIPPPVAIPDRLWLRVHLCIKGRRNPNRPRQMAGIPTSRHSNWTNPTSMPPRAIGSVGTGMPTGWCPNRTANT